MADTPNRSTQENSDPAAAGTAVPPGDERAALLARLQTAEQTRDQYLKMASQSQADFENYQKRAARDRAEEKRYASFAFAGDLLPALDNLDRAIAAAQQAGDKGAGPGCRARPETSCSMPCPTWGHPCRGSGPALRRQPA